MTIAMVALSSFARHASIQRLFLVFTLLPYCAYGSDQASVETAAVEITGVGVSQQEIRQGDKLAISVHLSSAGTQKGLTAAFDIVGSDGRDVAHLESDFFDLEAGAGKTLRFVFRWADLSKNRIGDMRIVATSIKKYGKPGKAPKIISGLRKIVHFRVVSINDDVHRMFVSRENSLWWLTEMGRIDNAIARRHGLANCVMFGGAPDSWLRNDYLAAEGADALCYWEITGYAVRVLALEYERSGQYRFLDLAKRVAGSIVSTVNDDGAPLSRGTLPTFNHYDGRIGNWYKGKAMLFDHGQILMGLLELVRVMRASGFQDRDWKVYDDAARGIGEFMLRARKNNGGAIPSYWVHETAATSSDIQPTSKVVIGFKMLADLVQNNAPRKAAIRHLDEMLDRSPLAKKDHHGRSYMAYGFIRAFKDYNDKRYLQAAVNWTESVAMDMAADGRLLPIGEYSVIPAQSQLIRNGALLWEITGEQRFLRWAERSANFLSRSMEPWTYRRSVLKLGRFYRQAGGLFNNIPSEELCSWASIFHIDAMYHYLRLNYGHVFVGPQGVVSMIGPVNVKRRNDRIELELDGRQKENIGVYLAHDNPIGRVAINGTPFAYYSKHTARLPLFAGASKVQVVFGKGDSPHLVRTNSLVSEARLEDDGSLRIVIQGRYGTTGSAQVYWPAARPIVALNGQALAGSDWNWNATGSVVKVRYAHDGKVQTITVASVTR